MVRQREILLYISCFSSDSIDTVVCNLVSSGCNATFFNLDQQKLICAQAKRAAFENMNNSLSLSALNCMMSNEIQHVNNYCNNNKSCLCAPIIRYNVQCTSKIIYTHTHCVSVCVCVERIMCDNVSLFRIYCVLINIGICK